MQYFKNISTIEQLRKSYNALAKQYHPDINHTPDAVRIMQDINAEYEQAQIDFENFVNAQNITDEQKSECLAY